MCCLRGCDHGPEQRLQEGSEYQDCEVLVCINKKSPDIADGVHVCKNDLDVGVDDQSIMFEYATDEAEDGVLLTGLMGTRLGKKLSNVRENGDLWWFRAHGKTQVTIERVEGTDESLGPRKIHIVVTHATAAAAREQENPTVNVTSSAPAQRPSDARENGREREGGDREKERKGGRGKEEEGRRAEEERDKDIEKDVMGWTSGDEKQEAE